MQLSLRGRNYSDVDKHLFNVKVNIRVNGAQPRFVQRNDRIKDFEEKKFFQQVCAELDAGLVGHNSQIW